MCVCVCVCVCVRVRLHAAIGLAGFMIPCPITLVHLLKEDISLSLRTVQTLCALRILCLGSLAGYLGEGPRDTRHKAACL